MPAPRSVPGELAIKILRTGVCAARALTKGGTRGSWERRARLPGLPGGQVRWSVLGPAERLLERLERLAPQRMSASKFPASEEAAARVPR